MNKEDNRGRFAGPWLVFDERGNAIESWQIQENAERAASLLNEHCGAGLKYDVKWINQDELRKIKEQG